MGLVILWIFDGNEGCVALRFDTGYCYWKISFLNVCNFVQVFFVEFFLCPFRCLCLFLLKGSHVSQIGNTVMRLEW